MARSCNQLEKGTSGFKILTGKPSGKRPLGRRKCRWEENIRMYLKEIGINTRNWIDSGKPTGKRPLGMPRRRWEKILEWTLKR